MMRNIFQGARMKAPKFNKFDLSHEKKMTIDMGKLYPFFHTEVLPGDSFRVTSEILARMAPMLAPVMHRVKVRTEYFYVPYRILYSDWEDFCTGGKDGTTEPVPPFFKLNTASVQSGYFAKGSLNDYFGLPAELNWPVTDEVNINCLPHLAYQRIWEEYYRDQNLQDELNLSKASGERTGAELAKLMTLRSRAWEKDMFTSALPWAQRGPDVLVPMEAQADVTYKPASDVLLQSGSALGSSDLGTVAGVSPKGTLIAGALPSGANARIENIDEVNVQNTSVTIRDFRLATALQAFYEKMAIIGARYKEYLKGVWGQVSSDARLDVPEWLGGGVANMQLSEVLSTFQAETGNPQGNMAGHGISYGNQNGFQKKFEEHGIVIGLLSIIPNTGYQQGIERMWTRQDRWDYYVPDLAHVGEQEVKSREVWYDPEAASGDSDTTFGYQSRFVEYKYMPNKVCGDFRDNLAYWHLGRIFDSKPVLNGNFITCDPSQRIFAVTEEGLDSIYVYVNHNVSAIRPIPYFSTPRIVG